MIESALIAAKVLGNLDRLRATLGTLAGHDGHVNEESVRTVEELCSSLEEGVRKFIRDAQTHDADSAIDTSVPLEAAKTEALYRFGPISMSIASLSDGRFLDANEVFLQRMGYARDELIGKTSLDLNIFHDPPGREWLADELRANGRVDGRNIIVRTKSGELRSVRYFARIADIDGHPCILSSAYTREDAESVEAEVGRVRRFYEELLGHLPADIAIFDPEGRYLYVSPASIRDPELREWIINKTDSDYWALRGADPGIADTRMKWLRRAATAKEVCRFEEQIPSRSGHIKHFIRVLTPMTNEFGSVVQVLGYGIDVTEFKQLEEQFRHSQKMEAIGRLAGGVAHDFNNLLTAIMGSAELVLQQLPQGDKSTTRVQEILNAANRAASLTRQLLAFSRRQVLQPRLLDVGEVLGSFENMLRRLITELIVLEIKCPKGLPRVKADPSQLEQVVLNLVVNARDAMPDGGTVSIIARKVTAREMKGSPIPFRSIGDFIEIEVNDSGLGIVPEALSHIFEPFYTTKEAGKGTGLGLSTVYAIVERCEGSISVETAPGRGTSFFVYLPCVYDDAMETSVTSEPTAGVIGSETVLVVEDEESVREVVCRILERNGYKVIDSSDGETALELARSYQYEIHALVSDIVMPGMSGRELSIELLRCRPSLRVLFMSGYSEEVDAAFVDTLRPDQFIQKPFTATALAAKVRELLDAK